MNNVQDVCKKIPGLMDNVGHGVRSRDTMLCARCEALVVMMNKIFSSKMVDSKLHLACKAVGMGIVVWRDVRWDAGAGMQIRFRRSSCGVKRCPIEACPWVFACQSEFLRNRMAYTAHVARRQPQA